MKRRNGYSYTVFGVVLGIFMLIASIATTLVVWPKNPTRTIAFALPYSVGPRLSDTAQQVSSGDFEQAVKSGAILNARSVTVAIDLTQGTRRIIDLVQGEGGKGVLQTQLNLGSLGLGYSAYTSTAPPKIDSGNAVVNLVHDPSASGWMFFPISLCGVFLAASVFGIRGWLTKNETDRTIDGVVYVVLGAIFWLILAIWAVMSF